jgi:hypothetical protein
LWGEGDNSLKTDPPNAVLAFVESGANSPEDAVIVIKQPQLEDGRLSYSIDLLEGTVPASGDGSSKRNDISRRAKKVAAIGSERPAPTSGMSSGSATIDSSLQLIETCVRQTAPRQKGHQ